MNKQQKQINKLLGKIKTKRFSLITYGKVFNLSFAKLLILLDFVLPSFSLLTLLGLYLKKTKKDFNLSFVYSSKIN